MKLELLRIEHHPLHTIGVLRMNGAYLCATLEPPWKDNKRYVSCIPCGGYTCARVASPKYGDTFEVTDVKERDKILFHAGNWASNTEGCILLGQHPGKLRDERAIINSGDTFRKFLGLTNHVNAFDLFVLSV